MCTTRSSVHVTSLVKGDERYVWLWTFSNKLEVLQSLSRFAADERLNFDWLDAARLAQKVRGVKPESEVG